MGQPGCGRRLPHPGQLTIGEELLGYHNNNMTVLVSGLPQQSQVLAFRLGGIKQNLNIGNNHEKTPPFSTPTMVRDSPESYPHH